MMKYTISLPLLVLSISLLSACGEDNPVKRQIGTITLANELSARGSLKSIHATEQRFMMNDADGSGTKDFWTADVSGLYRALRPSGKEIGMLSTSLAMADGAPLPEEEGAIGKPLTDRPTPKAGYLLRAITLDEDGVEYNQNDVNGAPRANSLKFAFCAYPFQHKKTGTHTFIINQAGTIYMKDTGGEPVDQWPASNPTTEGWTPK